MNAIEEAKEEVNEAVHELINIFKIPKVSIAVFTLLTSSLLLLITVVNAQQTMINEQKATIVEQTRMISEYNSQKAEQKEVKQEPQVQKMRSLGIFELTAYCPCSQCSLSWGGTTATGTIAKAGRTIGVNPDIIPYGTHVIINGHEYIAEDTGAAMREKPFLIDVFMETHEEALIFGRQKAEVFILE